MIAMATITTAEFALEIEATPKTARKFLRADYRERGIETPGKGSRWAIERRELKGLKTRYAKWAAAEAEARARRAQEAADAARDAVDDSPEGD